MLSDAPIDLIVTVILCGCGMLGRWVALRWDRKSWEIGKWSAEERRAGGCFAAKQRTSSRIMDLEKFALAEEWGYFATNA